MKKLLLTSAAAALLAVAAAPAFAADLPIEPAPIEPAYIPPPVFTWTGFYVGANAGYAWGEFESEDTVVGFSSFGDFFPVGVAGGDFETSGFDFDADGFIGGGQIGYNQQVGGFVFGVEADLQYSDIEENVNERDIFAGVRGGPGNLLVDPDGDFGSGVAAELDYFGTVRARAGFAMDRFMVYATGGLAYGDVKAALAFDNGTGVAVADGQEETHVGYAVGGGVEGAITDNLTAKVEYLYMDLGNETYDFAFDDGSVASSDIDFTAHIVRAGLNYKFSF